MQFHIDFGFILGKDPKPYPPAMKITKQMVTVLGGPEGEPYRRFRQYCCEAFNILRKHVNLFTNLFVLMLDAGLQDLMEEPRARIQVVIDRCAPDMSDEDAVFHLQKLIDESVTALFPKFIETLHWVAQASRA